MKSVPCIFLLCLLLVGCDLLGETYRETSIGYRTETLLEYPGHLAPLDLSPDETKILLSSDSQTALYDLESGKLSQLTSGDTIYYPVAFSPDGNHILYKSGSTIGIMDLDGSNRKPVIFGNFVDVRVHAVDFSPDGSEILINTFLADSSSREWHIGIYSLADETFRQLTTYDSRAVGYSPGGEKIVYWRDHRGDMDVWTMNRDGSGQAQLTFDAEDTIPVAVADNDWTILYYVDGIGENRIMTTNMEGSRQETVTEHPLSVPTAISPSGRYIAYYEASGEGICPLCTVSKVFLVRSSGTAKTQVKTGEFLPGGILAFFSDGNSFLHSSRKEGTTRILRSTIDE